MLLLCLLPLRLRLLLLYMLLWLRVACVTAFSLTNRKVHTKKKLDNVLVFSYILFLMHLAMEKRFLYKLLNTCSIPVFLAHEKLQLKIKLTSVSACYR